MLFFSVDCPVCQLFHSCGLLISPTRDATETLEQALLTVYFSNVGDILDTEPEIFDICNCLTDYKYKWMSIGEGLRVGDGDLESIRRDIGLDDGERLAKMLRIWRGSKRSPFTWRNISNVLEAPAIDLKRVADDICSRLSKDGNLYDKYNKQG